MNLLEHYILKVHSINVLQPPSATSPPLIEVDVTCDCWGSVSRVKHTTTRERWEAELQQGYFLA